jgi:hypothetical protein
VATKRTNRGFLGKETEQEWVCRVLLRTRSVEEVVGEAQGEMDHKVGGPAWEAPQGEVEYMLRRTDQVEVGHKVGGLLAGKADVMDS